MTLRLLTQGTFGSLYKFRPPLSTKDYILKVTARSAITASNDPVREYHLMSTLQGQVGCQVGLMCYYGLQENGDQVELVLQYLDGLSLDKFKLPMNMAEVERIFPDLLRAVATIHRAGIVHRDLKPSNVQYDGSDIYLIDFGSACQEAVNCERIVGTPKFMAPEAFRRPATQKSDIFSLGVVIYYLLTGKYPGRRYEPTGSRLDDVLRLMLQINPQHRPSAEAVLDMLTSEVEETILVESEESER